MAFDFHPYYVFVLELVCLGLGYRFYISIEIKFFH